jgi:hypothetical protein
MEFESGIKKSSKVKKRTVANLLSWLDCTIPSDERLMVAWFVWNQHDKVT